MPNQNVNHVELADGTTIMDIRSTTATPGDVVQGATFYDRSGAQQTGTLGPFTGATGETGGSSGLVPAPAAGDNERTLLGDGTWGHDSTKADKSAAISSITRNGTTFTATRADGTTFTFDQQDNNTTYSAGTGLSLNSSNQFSLASGVVTAGSAGPTANVSGNNAIDVPRITVDTYGRVTALSSKTYTGTKDTNTTYSAGTGISLSGTTFSLASGVVTAGSAGPTANVSGANSISVPRITVDTYGRVTALSSKTYTGTTDTNTWRPVQNNLTSTSTSDCLSANMGKTLNGKLGWTSIGTRNLGQSALTFTKSSYREIVIVVYNGTDMMVLAVIPIGMFDVSRSWYGTYMATSTNWRSAAVSTSISGTTCSVTFGTEWHGSSTSGFASMVVYGKAA